MIEGLKYTSPLFDHTGYGEASRNCILALNTAKVSMTLSGVAYESTKADNYGKSGAILETMVDANIPFSHHIMHLTPEHYPKYKIAGKKNIGFLYWETSKIPHEWVRYINSSVDAQLVCCDYTKDVLIKSGVTVPVYKVLPPFDMDDYESMTPYNLEGVSDNMYVYYSIFQWTERKNPIGLLLGYLTEFTEEDSVLLVLKTYRSNTSAKEQEAIKKTIFMLKNELKLNSYPKIFFIGDILTKGQMLGLHARGDCFVLPARSEGLGMPHAEAMAAGNPVIVTGLGGITEFMEQDNSYLLDYQMVPVCGMPWIPWYRGDQMWGEPNIEQFKERLRYVYENQDAAKEVGTKARATIRERLNSEKIGREFLEVLEKI